jgi:hypothetical protein
MEIIHDMYYRHVIYEHQQYELQLYLLHMVIGINLVRQITLGQVGIVHGDMIGRHQDEQMDEVQMIGECLMLLKLQQLG